MIRKCVCIKSPNYNDNNVDVDYTFGNIYECIFYTYVIHVYNRSNSINRWEQFTAFDINPESIWSFYDYFIPIEKYRENKINQIIENE